MPEQSVGGGRLTPRAASAAAPTRVAVLARHRLEADALATVLASSSGVEVAGVATDVQTLVAAAAADAPDVALLDVPLQEAIGMAACLRATAPHVAIVVIAGVADGALEGAAAARIEAVVPKDSPAMALVMAIHQVAAGSTVYPAVHPAVTARLRSLSGLWGLSGRQREVLRLLAQGRSNSEIADALFISVNTVKFHVRAIFRELGLHNRVQAAQRYAELAARTAE